MDKLARTLDLDFPSPLPISEAELALIECHFAAEIAALVAEAELPADKTTPPF